MATEKNVPISITPSSEELDEGKLTAQNLEIAIRTLHYDGLVIICDVYHHEDLDKLNQVMVRDALKMAELGDRGPKNFHRGNLSITPPPQRQYFSKNIFLNPIVSQVTSTHLGPKPKWTFNSANAALPSGGDKKIPALSQPTHTDAYFDHPRHPFADVISVPLVSMDAQNGATEVWLGTHTIMSGPELMFGASRESDEVGVAKKHLDERREKGFGPLQPFVPKGATVIRDIRLWHGGKPNHSDQPRIMLGQSESYRPHLVLVILKLIIERLVHFAPWYRNSMKLELADALKNIVSEEKVLDLPVQWVSDEVAASHYLQRGFGGDFDLTQTS